MMHVWRFIKERYPLQATIPLSAAIGIGTLPRIPGDWRAMLLYTGAVWLGLLLVRAADDLSAVEEDRLKSPQRGLVTGRIRAASLRNSCVLLAVAASGLLLLLEHGPLALGMAVCAALYYALWLKAGPRCPLLARPFCSNAVFALLPVCTGVLQTGNIGPVTVCCAGFVYLAAVAHEFAHNAGVAKPAPLRSYDQLIGTARTALLALLLFALSFACGIVMALAAGGELSFAAVLTAHMAVNTGIMLRLAWKPSRQLSRAMYVLGFTFFAVPLLARAVQQAFQ